MKAKILLIEDEHQFVQLFRVICERYPVDIIVVETLDDLESVIESKIDLIFLDWVMPRMTAFQAMTIIRAKTKNIPCYVLSGMIDGLEEDTLRLLHIDGFLHKFDMRKVVEIIQKIILQKDHE